MLCALPGIILHDVNQFVKTSSKDIKLLSPFAVDPQQISLSFFCGVSELDREHIMIDLMSIQDADTISLCLKCYTDLYNNIRPVDSLANFRWIGLVPLQLQDLTWLKEH